MASDGAASQNQTGCGARLRRLGSSICNTEKGEFFSRTPGSWFKITVFYIIFYSCLAGFFAALMAGFFLTIDPNAPTQRGKQSILKGNPGMGFKPMPVVDKTLIKFNVSDEKTYKAYVDDLNDFITEYRKQEGSNVKNCDYPDFNRSSSDVCKIASDDGLFGACRNSTRFGFSVGEPCVLLKMNKVFGWEPEIEGGYNDIRFTCEGLNEPDKDLLGDVLFLPDDYITSNWFPYLNQENYRSPYLFANFKGVTKGVLIQVWCKVWAKNIKHHKNDRAGSVVFELLVDDK